MVQKEASFAVVSFGEFLQNSVFKILLPDVRQNSKQLLKIYKEELQKEPSQSVRKTDCDGSFLFLEAAFQTILPSGIFSDTVLEILSKETNVKSDLNLYQSDFEFQSRCRYACPIIYNHMIGALFEQRYDIFIFQYFSFFFRKGFLYDKK